MSSKYQVIIRSSQLNELDTVAVPQGAGNKGEAVRIKAAAGQRYQLIDTTKAEGMAPDWVRVKRSGKNLLVYFEDSLEADLVIEDYYEVMPEGYNAVIGQAEVGGLYEYFPEDPDTYGLVPNLVDGSALSTNVVLGGAEIAGFELAALPLIGAFPWGLAAAGAAGTAALAGGGGDSGGGGGGGGGGGSDERKLKLEIAEVTDNGYLNQKESSDGVQTRVKFDFDVRVGDQIQVELQSQQAGVIKLLSLMVKLTAEDIKRGFVDVTVNNGNNASWVNGDYKAIAKLYDANGVELTDSNLIDFKVDTVLPTIGFTLDAITGDDFVAGSEKTSTSTLTGTATGDVKVGDSVTIIINGKTLQGSVGAGGKVVFAQVAGADLLADTDKHVDFKLSSKDAAGNEAVVDGKRAYTVEGGAGAANEGIKTAIRLEPIAGDNIITAAEVKASQTLPVAGTVTGKFAENDKVTLHVNNKMFTGLVDAKGKFSIAVPVEDLKNDVDTRVDAVFTGKGGDTATANQDYQVAPDSAPADPSQGNLTALFIDPITADNIINKAESTGNVNITGRVTGKFAVGDEVTLTLNLKDGTTIQRTAKVDAQGKFVATFKGEDLATDADTAITGTVTGTGGSTAHATQNYGVITDSPSYSDLGLKIRIATDALDAKGAASTEGDGWVNKAELDKQATANSEHTNKFVSIVSFNKAMMVVGDQLIVTAVNTVKTGQPVTESKTFTLTKEQIDSGQITVVFDKPGQDQTQTVTVVHQDAWGNTATGVAPSDRATEDTLAGNISLDVQRANTATDKVIDPKDFEQAKGVEIKVALPTDVEVRAGDVVSLQLHFDQQTNKPRESVKYTLKAQDVTQGFANVLFPPEWFFVNGSTSLSQLPYEIRKGNYWVDAELLDAAGNQSTSNQPIFELSQRDAITPGSSTYRAENETNSIHLKGGESSETIIAGSGNDWIYGGKGTNTLTGGAGSDVFIYNANSRGAIDTITDFKFGTAADKDVLMLKDLLSGFDKDNKSTWGNFFQIDEAPAGDPNAGKVVLRIDHDGYGFGAQSGDKVTINFANLTHGAMSQNLIEDMIRDGNIVV